jgi:hypothetical protein
LALEDVPELACVPQPLNWSSTAVLGLLSFWPRFMTLTFKKKRELIFQRIHVLPLP